MNKSSLPSVCEGSKQSLIPPFHSAMLAFSSELWHLLQCKLLNVDPVFSSSYEGSKEDLKAVGIRGY